VLSQLIAAALIAWVSPADRQRPASCYRYGAETTELRGVVKRRIFPGRPRYESIKGGDQPDTVYVLVLASSLCVIDEDNSGTRRDIRQIQLYASQRGSKAVRSHLGRAWAVRGRLRRAELGWHHLPVLLEVKTPVEPRERRAV
jgi:hypothetical protein